MSAAFIHPTSVAEAPSKDLGPSPPCHSNTSKPLSARANLFRPCSADSTSRWKSKINSLERTIEFLQTLHASSIMDLHKEIEKLQNANVELTLRFFDDKIIQESKTEPARSEEEMKTSNCEMYPQEETKTINYDEIMTKNAQLEISLEKQKIAVMQLKEEKDLWKKKFEQLQATRNVEENTPLYTMVNDHEKWIDKNKKKSPVALKPPGFDELLQHELKLPPIAQKEKKGLKIFQQFRERFTNK